MNDVLDQAIAEHNPSHVFALFSGGHDSICSTHLTAQHPAFSGVVHINTGIGVEQTREFVRQVCRDQGWPLIEMFPDQRYEDLVLKHGFPGPGAHHLMYRNLKEKSLARLIREHKTHRFDRIGLVTGVRTQESTRRMGRVEPIQRMAAYPAGVFIAPIHAWTKAHVNRYMCEYDLPRNPVVDLLHMSGECLCGAFAHPGERDELNLWFPETSAVLSDLETKVQAAGHKRCVWGQTGKRPQKSPGVLCVGCHDQEVPTRF